MRQQVRNFGRFYSAFHKLTIYGDPDEAKRQLVLQYTAGRTDSLKEITRKEYEELCSTIEGMNGTRDELKRRRSIALKLMQELEVNTTDWAQINDFCRHPRIAGKPFGQLSIDELMELATKLRSIKRKGWQRRQSNSTEVKQVTGHDEGIISQDRHITYLINLVSSDNRKYN